MAIVIDYVKCYRFNYILVALNSFRKRSGVTCDLIAWIYSLTESLSRRHRGKKQEKSDSERLREIQRAHLPLLCPRGALKTSPIEDEINERAHLSSPQKAHENAEAVREMPGVGEEEGRVRGGGLDKTEEEHLSICPDVLLYITLESISHPRPLIPSLLTSLALALSRSPSPGRFAVIYYRLRR